MPTPAEVLSIAKISEYLWNNAIPKERGLFNGTIDPRKAVQLYMEWKALNYGLEQDLSGIPGVSNYGYALCGAKLGLAIEILNNGSSGGSVVPGGGGFGVREYSKFASEGSVDVVFYEAIGSRLLYASRGGIDVGAILTSGTPVGNQVKWTSATGTLTVAASVPFLDGEYVRILVK